MNHIVLVGRLTKDPELKYTPNGVATASFTLAVDRQFTNKAGEKETDFIPIVTWQKQAENCANYLQKGRMCAVQGRLQIRTYDNKEGQKRWVTEVVAANVQFLDKAPKGQTETQQPAQGGDDLGGINLDDLPF